MQNTVIKVLLILLFCVFSCYDNDKLIEYEITAPKIILVAGQSNTCYGIGLDLLKDFEVNGIYQLGRFGNQNFKIIPAEEPLQHHSRSEGKIGFALTFAKLLFNSYSGNVDIIIVPCGFGSTGFIDQRWNKSDDLYNDAVNRVNFLKKKYPLSEVVAILWHQGEKDANEKKTHESAREFPLGCDLQVGLDHVERVRVRPDAFERGCAAVEGERPGG